MANFWTEHAYLLYIFAIGSFAFIGYLLKLIVKQGTDSMKEMTASISDLYGKYNGLEQRLSELHGAHDAFVNNGFHDRRKS